MSVGLPSLLFVLFLALRLTDHIDWAWYWVASPLWISIAVAIPLIFVVGFIKSREPRKPPYIR